MRAIKNWALATFLLTFLVIIAGGVVRTTQSGMGCPDWPRCFGLWIPPTTAAELPLDFEKYLKKQDIDHTFNAYHTWIEYFNRLLGVLLGLFAVTQLYLLYKRKKEQPPAFRYAAFFLGTVILTGLFGAVVVKLNLAHASISVHLLFAVVLTQIQLAVVLSLRQKINSIPVNKRLVQYALAVLLLIVIQSTWGTAVRMYVDDISRELDYKERATWLAHAPVAFIIHRSFSWLVLLAALGFGWYCKNIPAVKNKAYLLAGIIVSSMITGILLFYTGMPAAAQPLHLLLATLAITQACNILLRINTDATLL